MSFKEYPKMIYPHEGHKGIIVNNKEEEAKLLNKEEVPKETKPKTWGN